MEWKSPLIASGLFHGAALWLRRTNERQINMLLCLV
jgi:hypothetical protein